MCAVVHTVMKQLSDLRLLMDSVTVVTHVDHKLTTQCSQFTTVVLAPLTAAEDHGYCCVEKQKAFMFRKIQQFKNRRSSCVD